MGATLAYRLYCSAHRIAKRLLRPSNLSDTPNLFYSYDLSSATAVVAELSDIGTTGNYELNGVPVDELGDGRQSRLFYGENVLCGPERWGIRFDSSVSPATPTPASSDATALWAEMIENSRVPEGWRNEGLYLTGYIKETGSWCLSSWIWTSAAVARYYASVGRVDALVGIADTFLDMQLQSGSWLVRFDSAGGCVIPIIAPNDSAYIANNALLMAFNAVGDERYLRAAQRCAEWIMQTARADGLVCFGQNARTGEWIRDRNIVDVGFTAGLFCELYNITGNHEYLEFARRFIRTYVEVFFDRRYGAFSTSIDLDDSPRGGHFARGQAWALEGLIPYYEITRESEVKSVIVDVVARLLSEQNSSGAWPYNLSRPLMGEDCKGTPVVAKILLDWFVIHGGDELRDCAARALSWCGRHTLLDGGCPGGIFSYNVEGAVAHTLYSNTAFTYASCYALEAHGLLSQELE